MWRVLTVSVYIMPQLPAYQVNQLDKNGAMMNG